MVVVLEKLDVDVCDGSGVTGVVEVSDTGLAVTPEEKWVVEPSSGVVVAVAGAGVLTAAGVDGSANPASAEKKAV